MTINYDPIASNNASINGVPLGENVMQPSDVNDAIRELMADIAQSFPSMDLAVNIEGDASTRIFLHGGTTPDLVGAQAGAVTISTGDSTVTTVDAAVDDFLIESAGDAGYSVLAGATGKASMALGNSDDPDGFLLERLDGGEINLTTEGAKRLSITSAGLWSIYGGAAPDVLGADAGSLVISTGDSGATSLIAGGDEFAVESAGDAGISILSGLADIGAVYFGNSTDNDGGGLLYDQNNDQFIFRVNAVSQFRMRATGEFSTNNLTAIPTTALAEGVWLDNTGTSVFAAQNAAPLQIHRSASGTGLATMLTFRRNTTVSPGDIEASTTTTAYNTSSDASLKQNIADVAKGVGRAKARALRAKTFDWRATGEASFGFIANDLAADFPEAVSPPNEERDTFVMDYGKLTPALAAALNDALDEIDELNARLDKAGIA